ncbi:acyltransferase [Clostridium sp. KNHs214]|uniref:acyltransferase n=1 Tax=Clostridium sp. KNHs214 TaxID=1540257 RepID=UPI00054CFF9D|nr:acyltransferase [Clostridium sp. KNHs214]
MYESGKSKRLKEIDVLRVIAFIFVVEQHSMGGYSNIKGISYSYFKIFKFVYTMAKPAAAAFFCISAITLLKSYSEKFDCKIYYTKRIKKIILPYMIWSIIFIFRYGKYEGFTNLFGQILSGNAYYHLWYMGMIMRIYLYLPIILFIANNIHNKKMGLRVLTFLTLIIGYYYISKYQNVISNKCIQTIFTNPTKVQRKFINVSPLFWYLYFVIGIYIGLNYESFKKNISKIKIPVTLIYISLLIYAYLNEIKIIKYNRCLGLLYFVFSILFWYVISLYLSNKVRIYSLFNFIGRYSFAGYIIHVPVIQRIASILMGTFHLTNWLVIGLLTWVSTSLVAPLLVKLISYIPYSELITGIKSVSKKNKNVDVSI